MKNWWQSKTVWLNVFTTLSLLGTMGGAVTLSAHQAEVVTLVVAFANIVLRVWFTSTGINGAAPTK